MATILWSCSSRLEATNRVNGLSMFRIPCSDGFRSGDKVLEPLGPLERAFCVLVTSFFLLPIFLSQESVNFFILMMTSVSHGRSPTHLASMY